MSSVIIAKTMTYISDKEQYYDREKLSMQVSVKVWNGIAVLVNGLIANKNLAKDFPRQCPDGNGICGVDEHNFYTEAKSVIPAIDFLPQYGNIETLSLSFLELDPFSDSSEQDEKIKQFTYNTLDFIEFVFKHIADVEDGRFHDSCHHELRFLKTTSAREKFVSDVNEIFKRNNIAFNLCSNGEIQRIIDVELERLIDQQIEPKEDTLCGLLQVATLKIKNSKFEERKFALERLWDAFERLKTIINPDDKKDSANQLLEKVSGGNSRFKDELKKECKTLTDIGNNFQIRHHETNKTPIEADRHLDYLFFRIYSLIRLLLTEI